MIKQIEAYILYSVDFTGASSFKLSFCEMESCGYITVDKRTFDIEIPDDFDPRQKQVDILRKEKERIRADFVNRVTQIDKQINELIALECT